MLTVMKKYQTWYHRPLQYNKNIKQLSEIYLHY